jgi:hypothetical protein
VSQKIKGQFVIIIILNTNNNTSVYTYTINLFNSYFISYVKTFILLIAFYIIVITTIAISFIQSSI